jgi:NDP-sugar pyrophosphorylase family protein
MQNLSNITVVILAGGLGTRLRSIVSDRPKVLADVHSRPFLTFLLDELVNASAQDVVLCTGYMADEVYKKFGKEYKSLRLLYSKEHKPLGTGGALRLALSMFKSDFVLVMNGDSFIRVNLTTYLNWFFDKKRQAAILLTKVSDTARYGSVNIDHEEKITAFNEKETSLGAGLINAGIYLMKKSLIASIPTGRFYSLESELFPNLVGKKLFGFCCNGPFVDIGIPESYTRAKHILKMN